MSRFNEFSILVACLTLFFAAMITWPHDAGAAELVRVILDTDIATDCDDVGAVAVLHALADSGEAEILAMAVSSKEPWAAACLDALNTFYGRGDIPIGAIKGPGVEEQSKYTEAVAKAFPHDLRSTADAPNALDVYRQTLTAQPDSSVVVITVGYLTNLKNLLESPPDEHSPLNGVELVRRKVKHWVCMGLHASGKPEYNITRDALSSVVVIRDWPTPITFSPFEIGETILTGRSLRDLPEGNPVRLAYDLFNGLTNRPSWDQTAVWFAVRGPDDFWDIQRVANVELFADGSSQWRDAPPRNIAYLVKKKPPSEVAAAIEALMRHRPKTSPSNEVE